MLLTKISTRPNLLLKAYDLLKATNILIRSRFIYQIDLMS